jgi:hypothetical protein
MPDQQKSDGDKAKEVQERWDKAEEKVRGMEDDPPKDLEDWPTDEAKYVTFGGGEGDHGYEEGPEAKLGPSGLRRHEDGSIEINREEVDNPDDYKADEPIEGAKQTAD